MEFLAIELSLNEFLLFAFAGFIVGIINTMAGSGSLISLPVFIFICGLPPSVANGTNRVGVLFQSLLGYKVLKSNTSNTSFKSVKVIIPGVIGGIVGTLLALYSSEETMYSFIGYVMIAMFLVLIIQPKRFLQDNERKAKGEFKNWHYFIYFLIGVYGGYIQAGIGVLLLLSLLLLNHLDIRWSNRIKLLFVLLLTIPTLVLFIVQGQVHIGYGLLMAIFQGFGAIISAKYLLQIKAAGTITYIILLVVILGSIIKIFELDPLLFGE